jgi:hypothetical protein
MSDDDSVTFSSSNQSICHKDADAGTLQISLDWIALGAVASLTLAFDRITAFGEMLRKKVEKGDK